MRALGFILLLIILVAAVFFSMANREMASLGFWPLDIRFEMPIFVPIFVALAIGFLIGWVGAWMKDGRVRKQLRQALRDKRDLEVEADKLKAALKQAQSSKPDASGDTPQIAA